MTKEWSPRRGIVSSKDILDAANRHYEDGFVSLEGYYDEEGRPKRAKGDLMAPFIVNEIVDSAEEGEYDGLSDEEVIVNAIRRLENGRYDLSRAINGLRELTKEVREAWRKRRTR